MMTGDNLQLYKCLSQEKHSLTFMFIIELVDLAIQKQTNKNMRKLIYEGDWEKLFLETISDSPVITMFTWKYFPLILVRLTSK